MSNGRKIGLFTKEQEKWIKENVSGIGNEELANMVNKQFGLHITKKQMKLWKGNHHVSSGLTGRYEKGHIPANKGIKMSEKMYKKCAPTMFKKGHIPHNHKSVGSERINKYGYVEIKTAEPDKWVTKHQAVWEKEHGKIPKRHVVIFADANKQNFDIDNLICVDRKELIRINQKGRISKCREITKTNVLLTRLEVNLHEKRKEIIKDGK